MKRVAFYLFIASSTFCVGVFACALKTKQPPISPETREAEEYAVYSALINGFHRQNDGKLLLIQNRTEVAYLYDGTGDEIRYVKDHMPPTTSTETLDDFKSMGRQMNELDCRLAINNSYSFVAPDEKDHWFATREAMQEFRRKYADSPRITLLSRVGFNRSRDEALVYSWGYCGGDCGGGGYYLFRKENGRWIMKQEKTWIS
ncbi:MAG TPA: hypothetical protein VHQ64_09615 [Pyrinomonadaceae bacterium]|jgi:hypothetical protein|nr:hypothetical protein [Pyrinomonadaceae bacterium]